MQKNHSTKVFEGWETFYQKFTQHIICQYHLYYFTAARRLWQSGAAGLRSPPALNQGRAA
jgi:hypothetical protein